MPSRAKNKKAELSQRWPRDAWPRDALIQCAAKKRPLYKIFNIFKTA